MEYLETILFPLIYVLQKLLEYGFYISGSYGLSIILLSIVVSVVTYPLSIYATKVEQQDKLLHESMAEKLEHVSSSSMKSKRSTSSITIIR